MTIVDYYLLSVQVSVLLLRTGIATNYCWFLVIICVEKQIKILDHVAPLLVLLPVKYN